MKHARADYRHIQDPSGKIPENEPVFLLRAQDALAWRVVEKWALLAIEAGCDPELVEVAREQAKRMREWTPQKNPDL